MSRPRRILPVLVAAQFAGTALWFAPNAVLTEIQSAWQLPAAVLGWVTSSVQLGFIVGTLIAAFTGVIDRISRRAIFCLACVLGAAINLLPLLAPGLTSLLICRFLVGVCLAGVYPVGMALAASWYQNGLGRALGWLVGALVLGTAAPHGVRYLGESLPWVTVWWMTSTLAALGGVGVLFLVADGPHRRPAGTRQTALRDLFSDQRFRAAALGYFGHMWELYAMWTFVPALLVGRTDAASGWAFAIIAMGAVGCVLGGRLSGAWGSTRVARSSLLVSGLIAVTLPLVVQLPWPICVGLLLVWGLTVVADSPQLSTLTAQTAPPHLVGTGLALVTAVGFGVTIVSIQLISALAEAGLPVVLPLLALGPLVGHRALRRLVE